MFQLKRLKATQFIFICMLMSVTSFSQAAILCLPEGQEKHDITKYKNKVDKHWYINGFLGELNHLDVSSSNKHLEQQFNRVVSKAKEHKKFYNKNGYDVPETDCILSAQTESYVMSIVKLQQEATKTKNIIKIQNQEPYFKKWIDENFTQTIHKMKQCTPDVIGQKKEISGIKACLLRHDYSVSGEVEQYYSLGGRLGFDMTQERTDLIKRKVKEYNQLQKELLADIEEKNKNWTPTPLVKTCLGTFCIGDPISQHKKHLVQVNQKLYSQKYKQVERTLKRLGKLTANEGLTEKEMTQLSTYSVLESFDADTLPLLMKSKKICNKSTYSWGAFNKDGRRTTVLINPILGTDGQSYFGITSLKRTYKLRYDSKSVDQLKEKIKRKYPNVSFNGKRTPATSVASFKYNGMVYVLDISLSQNDRANYVKSDAHPMCSTSPEI